ncbi:MAG: dTMP kinase [Candidatus Diapherotrites archaeon]|nr:dTMP kinase [Candidatus Diapherotrites archaeon]
MRKGTFIVFDGISGCGKGTMVKKTFEYIYDKSKKYDNILITDEPTRGPHGLKLREYFKKQKSSADYAEEIFQLFVDDRKWHIENIIKPSLEKNFVVICDRYKYSSIAYQTAQGKDFNKVFAAHKNFLAPDLALILDVNPKEAHRRMHSEKSEKRKESDKFRSIGFISNLRGLFLGQPKLLPEENIKVIDANVPIEEVFAQIKPFLDEALH